MKTIVILAVIVLSLSLINSSFAQEVGGPTGPTGNVTRNLYLNAKQHPLTPVTAPTPFGNGTVLQLIIVYNTSPTEDGGLADYNKAVNFEKAKSIILGSGNTTTLQSIILELEKQRTILQTEGQNIKRYNPDGSETQEYSNFWMENYVTYRLEADGIQAISGGMQQGMSFQTALNQVEQSMQQILANYDVNGAQSPQTSLPPQVTNQYVPFSVSTDLPSYKQGDAIVLTGHIREIHTVTAVNLRLFNSHSLLISVAQIVPSEDGSFTKTFLATGPLWQDAGTYTIVAQYGAYANTTGTFHFNGGTGTTTIIQAINATYPLQSGGQIYNIPYIIKGATVKSMDIFASKYTFEITSSPATSDGSITVTLPRRMIDAKILSVDPNVKLNELQDDKFIVSVNGNTVTQFGETTNQNVRILSIPFHAGDTTVDIVGTVVNTVGNTQSSTTQQFTPSLDELLKQRMEAANRLQGLLHQNTTTNTPTPQPSSTSVFTPTQQNIDAINQAKANQTIAAEVNVGTNKSQTTSIDNNVSVQTTSSTPDSLNVNVSASSQTGPKVIAFNLNATTINVANLKDLGVMYDGKLISPAPNMDAILHAKPTDSPSFAIVVTQSGVQVLVLVPHFSTHSITITNMSKVIPAVPEFGQITTMILTITLVSIIAVSAKTGLRFMPKV